MHQLFLFGSMNFWEISPSWTCHAFGLPDLATAEVERPLLAAKDPETLRTFPKDAIFHLLVLILFWPLSKRERYIRIKPDLLKPEFPNNYDFTSLCPHSQTINLIIVIW